VRSFDKNAAVLDRVPGAVTRALATVDVGRGSEGLHRWQLPGLLDALAAGARISSSKASSALEGIVVADDQRADRIIGRATRTLRGRSEEELAGYRDGLDYVWQADWTPVNVGLVLHLHRLLLGHTPAEGGVFKTEDKLVVDRGPDGTQEVRFHPVSARETPGFTAELIARYVAERRADRHHPVLLVGLAVLDLLVIHPFADGNGRVARILTNALLDDAGYGVARYVSLEQLVAESADAYYASLVASTRHWHTAGHDPWPWLGYFVAQLGDAYTLFGRRAASTTGAVTSKRDRVKRYVLEQAPPRFHIADIRRSLPGISDGTIRNALDDLRVDGRVDVDGTGRGATWYRR